MIPSPILPEIALPSYSSEPITTDTIVYHSPDGKLYDLLCSLLTIAFGKEILPPKEFLLCEHLCVDHYYHCEYCGQEQVEGLDTWGDWFDFRVNGHPFHIHLSWQQGRDIYGEPKETAYFECYLTGSVHHPAMTKLSKILTQRDIPFTCYRQPPTLSDLIGALPAAAVAKITATLDDIIA